MPDPLKLADAVKDLAPAKKAELRFEVARSSGASTSFAMRPNEHVEIGASATYRPGQQWSKGTWDAGVGGRFSW